jgi:hypothetical protein
MSSPKTAPIESKIYNEIEDYDPKAKDQSLRVIISHLKGHVIKPEVLTSAERVSKIACSDPDANIFKLLSELLSLINESNDDARKRFYSLHFAPIIPFSLMISAYVGYLSDGIVYDSMFKSYLIFAVNNYTHIQPAYQKRLHQIRALGPLGVHFGIIDNKEYEELNEILKKIGNIPTEDISYKRRGLVVRPVIKVRGPDMQALRKLQKEKVATCLQSLTEAYAPAFFPLRKRGPFKDFLPGIAERICFPEPRRFNEHDKIFFKILFKKLNIFFGGMKDLPQHFKDYGINLAAIDKQLDGIVENIVAKIQKRDPLTSVSFIDSLVAFAIELFMIIGVEVILSPEVICNVLNRLLDLPIDVDDLDKRVRTPLPIPKQDRHFVKEVGFELSKIVKSVVKLGLKEESYIMSGLFKFIGDGERLGELFYEQISLVLASDCAIKPLLVAHHILVKDKKPTMPFSSLPQKTLNVQVMGDIFPLIEKLISDKITNMGKTLLLQLTDMRSFVDQLSKNLDKITRDPSYLKMLAFHVLKGVEEGIDAIAQ